MRQKMITVRSGQRPRYQVSSYQAEQDHSTLDSRGPMVQRIELHAGRKVSRRGIDLSHRGPECVHTRNNAELRNQRKQQHQADENIPRREQVGFAGAQPADEQRTGQERLRQRPCPSSAESPTTVPPPTLPDDGWAAPKRRSAQPPGKISIRPARRSKTAA